MNVLSVCSGIGAPECAWHPLGFKSVAFSEIDPFACWTLAARFGASRPMFMPEPEPIMRDLVLEPSDREAFLEVRRRRAAIRAVSDLPETGAVPNWGDMTRFQEWPDADVDVLVGGTPCQSFSVAGLRAGLADPRGNLALTYLAIAERYRPEWLVWENVPGVLSSDGGRDFGAILGALGQLGYGFAYRVLDAQFFGVAQRRRRVFVVANARDWRRAAAVLFERQSLSGDPAPRREAGEGSAVDTVGSLTASGRGVERVGESRGQDPFVPVAFGGNNQSGPIDVATARTAHGGPHGRLDFETETFVVAGTMPAAGSTGRKHGHGWGQQEWESGYAIPVAHSLRGEGFDAREDGTGRGTPLVPVAYRTSGNCGAWETGDKVDTLSTGTDPNSHVLAFSCKDHGADAGDTAPTLRAMGHSGSHANAGGQVAVAIQEVGRLGGQRSQNGLGLSEPGDPMFALQAGAQHGVAIAMAVRRLTPTECERLQDFPDGFTAITYRGKPAADGPRYKALGNSMAVSVLRWIGERIQWVNGPRMERE